MCDLKAVGSNIRGEEYTELQRNWRGRQPKEAKKVNQRVKRRQIKSVDISSSSLYRNQVIPQRTLAAGECYPNGKGLKMRKERCGVA